MIKMMNVIPVRSVMSVRVSRVYRTRVRARVSVRRRVYGGIGRRSSVGRCTELPGLCVLCVVDVRYAVDGGGRVVFYH